MKYSRDMIWVEYGHYGEKVWFGGYSGVLMLNFGVAEGFLSPQYNPSKTLILSRNLHKW